LKQLLVLSGKGGTGKTVITSAFITLSECRAFADCDVEAPNLHLALPAMPEAKRRDYCGAQKAVIDTSKCIHCGLCEENCRFEAIENEIIDIYGCEGCGVCERVCPTEAISMCDYASGSLILYKDEIKVFSTAQLKMGSGASGKLVSEVKKQLKDEAAPEAELALTDGSPGIGCPVIASVSGVDLVLIVAEPSLSGIHDLKRIVATVMHFGITCVVVINKYDTNIEISKEIEEYCSEIGLELIGKIPFDQTVVKAVNQCQSIASYPDSPGGKAVLALWNNLYQNYLGGGG